MRQHKIPRLNGTQATLLGFLAVILLGSGLLALPVSAAMLSPSLPSTPTARLR